MNKLHFIISCDENKCVLSLINESEQAEEHKANQLEDTVALMNSTDYKERFKAEYLQTKIRYDKLHKMLVKYKAGTLNFTPSCDFELLSEQALNMGKYLNCLEIRAEIEGIEL